MKSTHSKSAAMLIRSLLLMFALSGMGLLAGCDQDDTSDKVGDSIENAGDAVGDAADDAADAVDDAADDAADAADDAINK